MKKFYIHTMGCKSNQFEGSIIKQDLESNGLISVLTPQDADLFILNSCTVTAKSDNEAFYILRNIKHKNPEIKTVLTGCIAQVEKEKLLENDFVDIVIGNDEKLEFWKRISILHQSRSVASTNPKGGSSWHFPKKNRTTRN